MSEQNSQWKVVSSDDGAAADEYKRLIEEANAASSEEGGGKVFIKPKTQSCDGGNEEQQFITADDLYGIELSRSEESKASQPRAQSNEASKSEFTKATPIQEFQKRNAGMVVNNRKLNQSNLRMNETRFAKKGPIGKEEHQQVQINIRMKADGILERHSKTELAGLDVYFPFPPYECQKNFMERMIVAMQNGENALLESPTGTGKTLSLLCAALAWLRQEREGMVKKLEKEAPRIIYTSRTHSQLSQVQKELANTAYKPRSCLIASRDHLCVNSSINMNHGFTLNAGCRKSQKDINPCLYFKNRDIAQKKLDWEPRDIEDLMSAGKKSTICPYYTMKDRVQGADVIFMPYNYLIDEKIRENYEICYKNSVIIFDEAHNITSSCEEASSFSITTKALQDVLVELQDFQEQKSLNKETSYSSSEEDVNRIVKMTRKFLKQLQDFELREDSDEIDIDNKFFKRDSTVLPGSKLFNFMVRGTSFSDINIKTQKEEDFHLIENFDDISLWFDHVLTDMAMILRGGERKLLTEEWNAVLRKVVRLKRAELGAQFGQKALDTSTASKRPASQKSGSQESLFETGGSNNFYMVIQDLQEDTSKQQKFRKSGFGKKGFSNDFVEVRKLSFLCFTAENAMQQIGALEPRSIILTSGTLSPMSSFQSELGIEFKQQLENPHVINPRQVMISILRKGVEEQAFDFSYQNRENQKQIMDLGHTVQEMAQKVPGGILMFFPSYYLMDNCYKTWQDNRMIPKIQASGKVLLKEPKDPQRYQQVMDEYYSSIFEEGAKGAIMMGVCRGRISEGLDFSDNAARAVIIVGIPYPQIGDAKVILKKDFLDRKKKANPSSAIAHLSGKDWYGQQATRAVNQAIGRVIRHVQDYGMIVLADQRFGWRNNRDGVSRWLRDSIQEYSEFSKFELKMRAFYQQMNMLKFEPKVKQLEQLNVEIEEGEDKQYKPTSKEKQAARVKWGKKRATSSDEGSENGDGKVKLGFTPHMFASKNSNPTAKEEVVPEGPKIMTITKMFKNAPPPKRKLEEVKKNPEKEEPSALYKSKKLDQTKVSASGGKAAEKGSKSKQTKIDLSAFAFKGQSTEPKQKAMDPFKKSQSVIIEKQGLGVGDYDAGKKISQAKTIHELLRDNLSAGEVTTVVNLLKEIKAKSFEASKMTIFQQVFFKKYKDPKTAFTGKEFSSRIELVEKIGGSLPLAYRVQYFDFFDDYLKMKLTRPAKKVLTKSSAQNKLNSST